MTKKAKGKKLDGNCWICGKPVKRVDLWPCGDSDRINGAVVGDYIELRGHRACLDNVDRLVVVPNRLRLIADH